MATPSRHKNTRLIGAFVGTDENEAERVERGSVTAVTAPAEITLRPVGATGMSVAPLCLGAMNFGDPTSSEDSARIVDVALDRGINMIDVADVYAGGESERILGAALAANGRRDEIVLATKFGIPTGPGEPQQWHRREHIVKSCEQSLASLQTDHIDLYQVHRYSPFVEPEETLTALDELVQSGKVRFIGCSTFPVWALMEAISISNREGKAAYISEQPPYNLLDRRIENELLPMAKRHNIAIFPWSPLAVGVLANRYADGVPAGSRGDRRPHILDRLTPRALSVGQAMAYLGSERGLTATQMALLWCKDQPGVTAPIIGPRTVEQLEDALVILNQSLDAETQTACDELVGPGQAAVDFLSTSGWSKPLLAV